MAWQPKWVPFTIGHWGHGMIILNCVTLHASRQGWFKSTGRPLSRRKHSNDDVQGPQASTCMIRESYHRMGSGETWSWPAQTTLDKKRNESSDKEAKPPGEDMIDKHNKQLGFAARSNRQNEEATAVALLDEEPRTDSSSLGPPPWTESAWTETAKWTDCYFTVRWVGGWWVYPLLYGNNGSWSTPAHINLYLWLLLGEGGRSKIYETATNQLFLTQTQKGELVMKNYPMWNKRSHSKRPIEASSRWVFAGKCTF